MQNKPPPPGKTIVHIVLPVETTGTGILCFFKATVLESKSYATYIAKCKVRPKSILTFSHFGGNIVLKFQKHVLKYF